MNVSENTELYRTYGAHPAEEGWSFRVYAPSAREAALAAAETAAASAKCHQAYRGASTAHAAHTAAAR